MKIPDFFEAPETSVQMADLLNRTDLWRLSVTRTDGRTVLRDGDKVVYETDSEGAMYAFVFACYIETFVGGLPRDIEEKFPSIV